MHFFFTVTFTVTVISPATREVLRLDLHPRPEGHPLPGRARRGLSLGLRGCGRRQGFALVTAGCLSDWLSMCLCLLCVMIFWSLDILGLALTAK